MVVGVHSPKASPRVSGTWFALTVFEKNVGVCEGVGWLGLQIESMNEFR